MNMEQLISHLAKDGIIVSLNENKLKAKAAKGVLSEDKLALIKSYKEELIVWLQENPPIAASTSSQKAIVPREQDLHILPLSHAQQRMWLMSKMNPESSEYTMPMAFTVRGDFEHAIAQKALREIIARHEILRARIIETDGEPSQQILNDSEFQLRYLDLSESPEGTDSEAFKQELNTNATKVFDFSSGTLLRATYIKLKPVQESSGQYYPYGALLFNIHHIVSDGWSMGLLIQEFVALYQAFLSGTDSPLQELAIQYGDYVMWQRHALTHDKLQKQLDYWHQHLQNVPTLHSIPLQTNRPKIRSTSGRIVERTLSLSQTEGVRQTAQHYELTPFMLIHGVFALVLAKHGGNNDLVIGTPVANRQKQELSQLIGLFVNTLVLRSNTNHLSWGDYLNHIRQINLDAQANQDVPFELLVELCNLPRDKSHTPLFQIMLSMDDTLSEEGDLQGLELQPLEEDEVTTRFDLDLTVEFTREGLYLELLYDHALFDEHRMTIMMDNICHMLTNQSLTAQTPMSDISLLNGLEQKQVILRSQGPHHDIGEVKSVLELIAANAMQAPQQIAVVSESGQLTYAELLHQVNILAQKITEHGVSTESIVAISMGRTLERIIATLAVLQAGAAFLPLDSILPTQRLDDILSDAQPQLLLLDASAQQNFVDFKLPKMLLQQNDFEQATDEALPELQTSVSRNDLAYLMYTSGTTGKPKGVQVEHGQLLDFVVGITKDYGLTPRDSVLHFSSFSFDIAIEEVFGALAAGSTLVLRNELAGRDLKHFWQLCQQYNVTVVSLPTAFWEQLCFEHSIPVAKSLRLVIIGGEAVNLENVSAWFNKPGQMAALYNTYGPTETTVTASSYLMSGVPQGYATVPIGRATQNTQLYVLDEYQNLLPNGCVGELYIGGKGVCRGYLNRPELNQERFIPDPFSSDKKARLYRSGDLVRYHSDGNLIFIGRTDDQVKIRGYRIEIAEVEVQLAKCDGVGVVAVIPQEIDGEKRLIAYVTLTKEITKSEIVTSLSANLPDYMLPQGIVFMSQLPVNSNGKIDKRQLPAPEAEAFIFDEQVAPQGPVEEALAEIWASLLKVHSISRNEHFFRKGGHSLLAIRLISEIRSKLGWNVDIAAVFDYPVFHEFAANLEQTPRSTGSEVIPVLPRDNNYFPLSYAQTRLWFIDQLEGGSPQYNMPAAWKVSGEFNVEQAELALALLIDRHETLRTVFREMEGQPCQVILDEHPFKLKRLSLTHLSEAEQASELAAQLVLDANLPFDLSQDLMIRATFVSLNNLGGKKQGVLLINTHHIAFDGWSDGILLTEFSTLYRQLAGSELARLAPLPLQYVDYAAWQKDWLAGDKMQQQLAYWGDQLADVPILHGIPLDYPRRTVDEHKAKWFFASVPPEILRSLEQVAQKYDLTMFMLLHGILSLVIARHSHSDDIVVGTPVANRRNTQLESIIGFFVNTLVLRVNTDFQSLEDYFSHIREVNLQAQRHQDVPFETVVQHCKVSRTASHTPLFQILFTMDTNEETTIELEGVNFEPLDSGESYAKFDLDIGAKIDEEGLHFSWTYDASIFKEERIKQMQRHLKNAIESLCSKVGSKSSDTIPVADIELLDEAESHLLLHQFNPATPLQSCELTLDKMIAQQAQQTPDKIAVRYKDELLTYAQLDRQSNRLAITLQRRGVGCDDLIGLCIDRGIDMVVALVAILKAGGAYVPFDVALSEEIIRKRWQQITPKVTLVSENTASIFPEEHCCLINSALNSEVAADTYDAKSHMDSLGYVLSTSGSTGEPKHIAMPHRALVNLLRCMRNDMTIDNKDIVTLQFASIGFDMSFVDIFLPLVHGGTVVMLSEVHRLDVNYLIQLYQDNKVTVSNLPYAMLNTISEYLRNKSLRLTDLKYIFSTAEALKVTPAIKHFFKEHSQVRLFNHYGPSETHVCTALALKGEPDSWPEFPSIGKPLMNTRVYVLDNHQRLTPFGAVGELYVAGECLAREYLGREDLTAERFVTDPFSATLGQKMYRTGDLVRFSSDGELLYIGRQDNQVKIRGFRVEPGAVEQQLTYCPDVQSCVVVVVKAANGENKLIAYVEPKTQQKNWQETSLHYKNWLLQELPDYMIPSAFIKVTDWPLNTNGKIDHKCLPKVAMDYEFVEYKAPQSETERDLVNIIAGLLQLNQSELSIRANFFELGGHSLMAVRLANEIEHHFLSGKERFDIKTIFDVEDLEEMAYKIDLVVFKLNKLILAKEIVKSSSEEFTEEGEI